MRPRLIYPAPESNPLIGTAIRYAAAVNKTSVFSPTREVAADASSSARPNGDEVASVLKTSVDSNASQRA